MKKWIILVIVLMISLTGCSGEKAEQDKKEKNNEQVEEKATPSTIGDIDDIGDSEVVAKIEDHEIVGQDIVYEMKRLELISFLEGNEIEEIEVSPDIALQELIRNHMIHHIAKENGITVDASEQKERAKAVREDVESVEGYEKVMADIDEELFWSKEEDRYEVIIEAESLLSLLKEEIKETHPDAEYTDQALQFDAQEDLDEWIQEKIADADIEITKS